MAGRRRKEEAHENEERWLLTYADLITLLMVFFVVMYALSNADKQRFQALATALRQVFGKPVASVTGIGGQVAPGVGVVPPPSSGDSRAGRSRAVVDAEANARRTRMRNLKDDLESLVKSQGMQGSVQLQLNASGSKLTMGLSDSLLFDAGSAELTAAAQGLVGQIGQILAVRSYDVNIQGHTDNVPIHNARYSSNFQLSTDRAVNVISYLIQNTGIPPNRFSASGYGEFHPLGSNDTPEGRAQNRRVEFVIFDPAVTSATESAEPVGATPEQTTPETSPDTAVAPPVMDSSAPFAAEAGHPAPESQMPASTPQAPPMPAENAAP
jgi:chemotaxis protein MotB